MISFKKYYEQVTLGIVEPIFIEDVGEMDAKVDSGNDGYNVLGASNIVKEGDKVRFLSNNKTLFKKIVGEVDVRVGAGVTEPRYMVNLNIKFKDRFYENIPFSLAKRDNNDYQVLIGTVFLKKIDALIQTNGPERLSEAED